MSRLLALLPLIVYTSAHPSVMDTKQSASQENQFDVSPQSISIDDIGKIEENTDMFVPPLMNGDVYRYPLSAWNYDQTIQRSPGYPMMPPYYGNLQYVNRFNMPSTFNRYGYVPQFNRLPYTGPAAMYPQISQNLWRNTYAQMPTNSDLQFSYLMTHPQAAMTYQNLAYN